LRPKAGQVGLRTRHFAGGDLELRSVVTGGEDASVLSGFDVEWHVAGDGK
jgi:hypothetical protein